MKLRKLIRMTKCHHREQKEQGIPRKKTQAVQIVYPFQAILHPVNTYQAIKYEHLGSVLLATVIFALFFLARIFSYLETGYLFNYNRADKMNLWIEFMSSTMICLLWCVCNWAVCTLMNGEGKFSEIYITTAYSFLPFILALLICGVVSRFLTRDEGVFCTVLEGGALLLTALEIIISNMIIHQYDLKHTLLAIFLTVVGIAAVLFLMILFLSMFQQFFTFLSTLFREIVLRQIGG